MSASSTFGALLNSVNFFIDTRDSEHKGDNATIHMHNNSLTVGEGQLFKICLTEFHMARSWPSINSNNNKITVVTTSQGVTLGAVNIELTGKTYGSIGEIATEFAEKLRVVFAAQVPTGVTVTVNSTSPAGTFNPGDTGDGIFEAVFNCSANHSITNVEIQCFKELGDSYLILGGDALNTGDTLGSFNVDLSVASQITVKGRYMMQKTSDPYIYLRTDLRNNNIESKSLSGSLGTTSGHTLTSNIIAKIPNDFEHIHFVQSGAHDEHFAFLPQKNLSTIRLFLTDHAGRPLGDRSANSQSQTAFGAGLSQSISGNLFFQATLRIDTILRSPPSQLQTRPIPQTITDQTKIGPLRFENFGGRN